MSCRTSTWVDLRQNRHAKRCGPIRLRLPGLVPLLLWKLRFVIYYLRRVICFAAGNVLPTPTYKQGKETNLIMNSDICDWFCTLDFGWVWCWSSGFFHGGHFDLYLKVLLRAAFTSALWNISQHIKPYENLRQLCIAWPLSYHGCWQHFWVQFVKRAMLQFRSAWFSKFYYCSAVIIAGIFFAWTRSLLKDSVADQGDVTVAIQRNIRNIGRKQKKSDWHIVKCDSWGTSPGGALSQIGR